MDCDVDVGAVELLRLAPGRPPPVPRGQPVLTKAMVVGLSVVTYWGETEWRFFLSGNRRKFGKFLSCDFVLILRNL